MAAGYRATNVSSIVKRLQQQESCKTSNLNISPRFRLLSLSASFRQKRQFRFSHRSFLGNILDFIDKSVRSVTIIRRWCCIFIGWRHVLHGISFIIL